MVMFTSGDIFQLKSYELLGDTKGVKLYFDDILLLREGYFTQHTAQIKITLAMIIRVVL